MIIPVDSGKTEQTTDPGAKMSLGTATFRRCQEPRHVLFLIDRFPYKIGGAEGTLLKITRRLTATRYRCSVATFAVDARFGDARELFTCPLYVFPMQRIYDWNALRVGVKIANLIQSQRVNIVHTFFSTSDLWGGLVAKLSGCPVLISSRRDMGLDRHLKQRLGYRWLSGMFDQTQAVSERVREFCITHDGLDPSRVVTLHNGADLEEIDHVSVIRRSDVASGVQEATHLIATVGNIRPVKGIDVLIRAAARVCEQFPRAVFLIIGWVYDEAYFRNLQDLTTSFGLTSNVRFLGLRDDVISILKICDVFCLPSRSEGLSNALLEAMACKLPCVVTGVGGNGEVVENGKSGFLVPSEDSESVAKRIVGLLRDPKGARAKGEAGRKIIEDRFSAQAMVDRLVNHYDTLLGKKNCLR